MYRRETLSWSEITSAPSSKEVFVAIVLWSRKMCKWMECQKELGRRVLTPSKIRSLPARCLPFVSPILRRIFHNHKLKNWKPRNKSLPSETFIRKQIVVNHCKTGKVLCDLSVLERRAEMVTSGISACRYPAYATVSGGRWEETVTLHLNEEQKAPRQAYQYLPRLLPVRTDTYNISRPGKKLDSWKENDSFLNFAAFLFTGDSRHDGSFKCSSRYARDISCLFSIPDVLAEQLNSFPRLPGFACCELNPWVLNDFEKDNHDQNIFSL